MKAILIALTAFSAAAIAAPHFVHPPMGAANMSHAAAPLTKSGKVTQVVDAKSFTYMKVDDGTVTRWVVSPKVQVKAGDAIRYADGAVMAKFHSPTANRDFSNLLFTTRVVVGH